MLKSHWGQCSEPALSWHLTTPLHLESQLNLKPENSTTCGHLTNDASINRSYFEWLSHHSHWELANLESVFQPNLRMVVFWISNCLHWSSGLSFFLPLCVLSLYFWKSVFGWFLYALGKKQKCTFISPHHPYIFCISYSISETTVINGLQKQTKEIALLWREEKILNWLWPQKYLTSN